MPSTNHRTTEIGDNASTTTFEHWNIENGDVLQQLVNGKISHWIKWNQNGKNNLGTKNEKTKISGDGMCRMDGLDWFGLHVRVLKCHVIAKKNVNDVSVSFEKMGKKQTNRLKRTNQM